MKNHWVPPLLAAWAACLFSAVSLSAAEVAMKQPVFLICPHKETYSSWSLYLEVERDNPSKIKRLVLEKLTRMNSKDESYERVQTAQGLPDGNREQIAELNAPDFGQKELRVKKDDALHVSLDPLEDQAYRLNLSLRVGASERFVIGGKNRKKNEVILRFNKDSRTWGAYAARLTDPAGKNLVSSGEIGITGINFPVSATGIYTIVGVFKDSDAIKLMDRSWNPDS